MKTTIKKSKRIAIIAIIIICFSSHFLSAQRFIEPIVTNDKQVQNAVLLYEKDDNINAKSTLEAIIKSNPKNADAHYALSVILAKIHNLEVAIDEIKEALDIDKGNAEYHYTLARLQLIDMQSASIFRIPSLSGSIKSELLEAIRINSKHRLAIITLGNYYYQAPSIAGGSTDKAIEQANNLIKIDPKEGHRLLSQIYNYTSNFPNAIDEANQLLKIDEYPGRIMLIQIYKKQGENIKAEKEYKAAEAIIGNNPDYYGFFNDYGYFLLNQGRIDEAIDKFKKQVSLAPKSANAHDSLGEGYFKKGMLNESLAEYNKAIEIDPNFKNAKDKVEEIKGKLGK